MVWLLLLVDASASGRFAVPPGPERVEQPDRFRARPTLLNPASHSGRTWTLGALADTGRFPVQECDERVVGYVRYRTCGEVWLTAPEPLVPQEPWWAFWR